MSSINWTSELAKLEREFDGRPAKPTPTEIRRQQALEQQAHKRASDFAVWARLALVAALAGALGFWPYARDCGAGLYAFISAGTMVIVGGLWVAVCTWRNRLAFSHVIAIVLMIAGMAVVAHQILPRVGYATVNASSARHWSCPDRR